MTIIQHHQESADGMKWQMKTPVALLIFNRPDTTESVLQAIRNVKPPELLVIADGPRPGRPEETERCAAARAVIDRIDWNCKVHRNFADKNLGLRTRVYSGLDWVFQTVEEAIILEDDCVPHPSFFRFCEELLERYRNDKQVMLISGDNAHGFKTAEHSYYFSRYALIWGWATWRRAWQLYDNKMSLWPKLRDSNWLASILSNPHEIRYWSSLFQSNYEGFNSWARAWIFSCWVHKGLGIIPATNLISNIGFGSEATHTKFKDGRAEASVEAMNFPLQHPLSVIRDSRADDFIEKVIFSGMLQSKAPNTLTIEAAISQAIEKLNTDNNAEALNMFEKVIVARPDLPWLNYGKALAQARLKHPDKAINTLKHLLKVMPSHRKARLLLDEIMRLTNTS